MKKIILMLVISTITGSLYASDNMKKIMNLKTEGCTATAVANRDGIEYDCSGHAYTVHTTGYGIGKAKSCTEATRRAAENAAIQADQYYEDRKAELSTRNCPTPPQP